MSDVSKMSLKILYTLDNGSSGTYLARSKKPQQVRVASIPPNSPNDGDSGAGIRIGAVELSTVLNEIYLNSPELLNGNMTRMGIDYNLYYKDICEADEPLVSLGLLSQIRQKLSNRRQQLQQQAVDEEMEEEDVTVVMGRVCSNFQVLLKQSCSNKSRQRSERDSFIPETLELKLRLIKVVNAKSGRKNIPTIPNIATKVIRPTRQTRRPTNPTPAPKAGRTQSLPIWNMEAKDSDGAVNSIARKIYLADRRTELEKMSEPVRNPLAYQISSLQQDNTIQKTKLDTSVSRRFESLSNKRKRPQQQQQQHQPFKKPANSRKAQPAAKARRCNTMATIPGPSDNESKPLAKRQEKFETSDDSLNSVVEEMLGNDDKENFPPSAVPTEVNDEGHDMELDLLSFSEFGEMDWFQDFDPFNSHSLVSTASTSNANTNNGNNNNNNNNEPIKNTTPRDQSTCNIMIMGDDEAVETDEVHGGITSDIDRTSPIDTLSMPLMELSQQPHAKSVTCYEQLKRLPLMGPKSASYSAGRSSNGNKQYDKTSIYQVKQSKSKDDEIEDDRTSIVGVYSTPSQEDHLKKREKSQLLAENSSPAPKKTYVDDDDTDEKIPSYKRQRTIPSSPMTMFNFQDDLSSQGDEDDENNDLFSSFVAGSRPSNLNAIDSTPATQYQNQSSDNVKL